ncbi:MAG: hypothetical protein SOZ80_02290 [Prevotella sp.]|uniref:hypothetical protein n=1 Tax=Prevotella sp. TaxID=59823 RepID=UPI002A2A6914|nr:hypothetical protein [Prevotella sp.]MDD7319128.1 hypothetical protein [Prevotellaceae bacterium]MDY4019597.1 hypothetical protein [Prevotella sp.]
MRRLIYAVMLVSVLAATGCGNDAEKEKKAVALFAKGYYERLIEGNYEGYVDALNYPDSLPDGYRRQLVLNAKAFAEQQKGLNGGWVAVEIAGCRLDSLSPTALVTLRMCYADSTRESVVVPMVERGGRWYIR